MYSLMKDRTFRDLTYRQLPEFVLAMVVAELFYRFHSFTLETLAFVTTWFAIDFAVDRLVRLLPVRRAISVQEGRE